MNTLYKIIVAVVLLAAAYGTGRYMSPTKVETKEVVKTNVEYVTRVVKQPDGTVIKETVKKEQTEKEKQSVTENKKANTKIGVIASHDFTRKDDNLSYAFTLEKRLVGNVFGGVYVEPTAKKAGLSLSMEF